MKRVIMALALVSMFFGITAFECASKELDSAKLYIKQENYEKAKEQLDAEISKNPQNDEAYYLYGKILGEENDISGMVEKFNKSLEVAPTYKAEIDQTLLYYWSKKYNSGAELLQKANTLSDGEEKEKTFNSALDAFRLSALCEPDSAISQHGLTIAYLSTGNLKDAVVPAERYVELTKTPEAYTLLSDVYFAMGYGKMEEFKSSNNVQDSLDAIAKYEKVIDVLKEAREKYPDNTDLLQKLSNAYISADKLLVAMDTFKEGIEKEPENKQYRYNYGVVLLEAGDYENAIIQFEKAIEIDPEYSNAYYNLAITYIRWGQDIRDENEAKELDNDDYKPKFKNAIEPLEKYLEISPEESTIWSLLGKVYANLGDTDKANEAFQRADEFK